MRKIIHMFIAAVLLVSTTGMTINLHYCYEQLYDVGLNKPAESCCDNSTHDHHCNKGISDEVPDHCQDETIIFKITADYLAVSTPSIIPADQSQDKFFLVHHAFDPDALYGKYNLVSMREYHKPPPSQKIFLSQIQSYRL